MGAGSNNLMSTQTGGVGETIQAENTTQATPEEFQANIPPVQAETPQTEVPSEVPAEQIANEEPPPTEGPLTAEEQPAMPMVPTEEPMVEEPISEEPSAEQPMVPEAPIETETDVINRLGLENVEPAFDSSNDLFSNKNVTETPDGIPVLGSEQPVEVKDEGEAPLIQEEEKEEVVEPEFTPDGIPIEKGPQSEQKLNLADINAKYKNEGIKIDDLGKITVGAEEKKDAQGLPDGSYRLAGKSANYQKIDGKWYKDANLTGDYQPIGGDNAESRAEYLESNAQATVSETQKKANEIINQRFGDMRKEVEGNRVAENNFTFDDFVKGKDNTQQYNPDGTINFNYAPKKEVLGVEQKETKLPDGIYKYPGSNASYKRVNGDWMIDPKGGTNFVPMTKGDVTYRKAKLDTDAILQYKPDGVYIYPGSKASYKRVNGDWLIDPTGGSNYVEMTHGNVDKRKAQLDLSAVKAMKAGEYKDLGAIIKRQGVGTSISGIPNLTPSVSVEQSMMERTAKASEEKRASFNKAQNFANTDIMSQLTVKAADGSPIQVLTGDQMTSFLEYQNKIKDIIGDGSYTVAKAAKVEEVLKQAETYFNESKQINAEINKARAENKSLSRVSLERKMEMADDLLASGKTDIFSEDVMIFNNTSQMADFVLSNVDNGKMRFDAEAGQYVISPNISGTERQYLEGKLAEYVDYYTALQGEKYAESQANIQDDRQKLAAEKRNIVKLESSLSEMKRNGVDEKSTEYQAVVSELEKSKSQAEDYDTLIDKKTYATDAAFLTEPKKTAQNLALSLSQDAYNIIAAIPRDITPKQQFDLIYERLAAENDRIAKENGLNTEGLGNANMKVKDMVDWDGFYALSKVEKQWLQNKATLTKMAPLYFNNSDMLSNEGTGFWESFTNSFYSTLFPNTAKAEGFANLSEASATTAQKLQEFGFKEDDYVTPEMAKKLEEQSKVDFWSMEKWGGMTGTTAAIIAPMVLTAGVPSTALRVVKGIEGLITGANVTRTAKIVSTAEKIYNSALQSTRFGRFLKPTIESAVKAEIAGDIFTSQEDELNFLSFMAGGVVSESLGVFFSKMPKDQVYKYLQGVFGNKVNAAINVIKKGGEATARGIGETGEETMQELVGIYQRTDNWQEMKAELDKQFGTFDQVQEFIVSSFIMGAGFGLTESKGAKDAYEKLPPKSKEQVDAAIEAIRADLNEADSKVEEFAENKEKQQAVEQTIEENDKKDEEGVSGQVGEGQEPVEGQPVTEPSEEAPSTGGVVQEEQGQAEQVTPTAEATTETPAESPKPQKATARSLEEAKELAKQGYVPADRSLSSKGLDNIFNTRKKLNMVKIEEAPATETPTVETKEKNTILNKDINASDDRGRKGLVPLSELEAFVGEDRLGDAEMPQSRAIIDKLKEDISKNGFKEPIVLVYDKFSNGGEASIIEGNHRIIAAKELGLKEIPVTFEKGTLRDNEKRVSEGMFPLNRKQVGAINDNFGVRGSDLGLTVRQPIDSDYATTETATEPTITPTPTEPTAEPAREERAVLLSDLPTTDDAVNDVKVMGKNIYIPRSVYEAAYENDSGNKGYQPLNQIISRGGYSAKELDKLLPDWKERVYAINNPGSSKPTSTPTTAEPVAEVTTAEPLRDKKGRTAEEVINDRVLKEDADLSELLLSDPIKAYEKIISELEEIIKNNPRKLFEWTRDVRGEKRELKEVKKELDFIKKSKAAESRTANETTAEPVIEGRTISQISKDFANKIRGLKTGGKGNIQSNVLGPVWDMALEAVAKTIEVSGMSAETIQKAIDAGFKVVKDSDWYKGLDKAQKQQAAADYNAGMNNLFDEGKMTSAEKAAAKEFGKKVASATGTAKQPKTVQMTESQAIRERMRVAGQTAKQLRDIRRQILDYAKANLPKSEYTNLEINRITAALNAKDLEAALDKIDTIIAKKNESTAKRDAKTAEGKRNETIKQIKNKAKSKRTLLSREGNRWVGKTTVEAQKEYLKFINNINMDELDGKTQEELDEINDIIDGIVSEGKADYKRLKALKDDAKRERAAKLIQGLAKGQGKPLNSVDEIIEFFEKEGGGVVIDGKLYNKSSFKTLINKDTQKGKQGDKIDDITEEIEDLERDYSTKLDEVKADGGSEATDPDLKAISKKINAKKKQLSTAQAKYDSMPDADVEVTGAVAYKQEVTELAKISERLKNAGFWRRTLNFINPLRAVDDLQVLLTKTWGNSSDVALFVKNNISDKVNDAFVERDNRLNAIMKEYYKALDDIFGKYSVKELQLLKERAKGLVIGYHSSSKALNKLAEPVEGLVKSEVNDSMVFTNSHVVDIYNLSQLEKGKERLTRSGVNVEKAINIIESDPQLKAYADWLMNKYKELGIDYEPMFIAYTGTPFPSGKFPYYPGYASDYERDFIDEGSVMGENGSFNMLGPNSPMSNNMRQRTHFQGNFNITMDAHAKFIDYVKNNEHAKAFLPIAASVNELFSTINTPHLIKKLGIDDYNELKATLVRVLTDRPISQLKGAWGRALNKVRQFATVATLGLKPASAVLQATSFANYWTAGIKYGVDPHDVFLGVPKSKDELQAVKALWGSDYVKDRLSGEHIDIERRRLMDKAQNTIGEKAWTELSKSALTFVRYGDYFSILHFPGGGTHFFVALYRKALADGMTHQEAIDSSLKKYINTTESVMQTSRADLTSNMQLDDTYRMLGAYRTSQTAASKQVVKGIRTILNAYKIRKSEGKEKRKEAIPNRDVLQSVVDIVWYSFFNNVMFANFSTGAIAQLIGAMGEDDDEADKRAWYDVIMDSIGSSLQGYGFIGYAAGTILDFLRGDDWKLNVPIIKKMDEFASAVVGYIDASGREWGNIDNQMRKEVYLKQTGKAINSPDVYKAVTEAYDERSAFNKMTEKEVSDLTKSIGANNVIKLIDRIGEAAEKDEGLSGYMDAVMGWEDDYLEEAKENGRKDRIYEWWYGEPYVPENKTPKFTPMDTNRQPDDIFIEPEIQDVDVEGGRTTTSKDKYRPVW